MPQAQFPFFPVGVTHISSDGTSIYRRTTQPVVAPMGRSYGGLGLVRDGIPGLADGAWQPEAAGRVFVGPRRFQALVGLETNAPRPVSRRTLCRRRSTTGI